MTCNIAHTKFPDAVIFDRKLFKKLTSPILHLQNYSKAQLTIYVYLVA